MAKRFEDDELNKWLDEQFIEEAEAMEKLIFAEKAGDDYETTDEETLQAFDDLVARLQADGVYREDTPKPAELEDVIEPERAVAENVAEPENAVIEDTAASEASLEEKILSMPAGTEKKELQTDTQKKTEEKAHRRSLYSFARVACLLFVCIACLFGATMTSEANRKYVINQMRVLSGDNTRVVVDNDETNESVNSDEYEAIKDIEDTLGVDVPEFFYRPHKLEFYKYTVDEFSGIARMEYQYGEYVITFLIDRADKGTASELSSFHGDIISTQIIEKNEMNVKIKAVKDILDSVATCVAQWKKDEVAYYVFGKMEYEELKELIKYMNY